MSTAVADLVLSRGSHIGTEVRLGGKFQTKETASMVEVPHTTGD